VHTLSRALTAEDLRAIARQAVSDFMRDRTDLTSTVTKAASASGEDLTADHCRRICEMAYHDAFERLWRAGAGSEDRFVSFDPPEAEQVARNLRATKVAGAANQTQREVNAMSPGHQKAASAPPARYEPALVMRKAFDSAVSVEGQEKIAWYCAAGDVYRARQELVEAVRELEVGRESLDHLEKTATRDVLERARQACLQGASVAEVLYACTAKCAGLESVSGLDSAEALAAEVASYLGGQGFGLDADKVASLHVRVNPAHPMLFAFAKAADYRSERVHIELALEDVRRDLRAADEQIRALVT